MQDLLALNQVSPAQVQSLLQLSHTMKQRPQAYSQVLQGKSIALLFEKPSLRTRSSFAAGINRLGGHSIYLDATSIMGARESTEDVAANLACWHDAIVARVYQQHTLESMAAAANKPVINALSDSCHPCQALADLLTLAELFGDLSQVHVTWIGDGNNVCQALMHGAARVGMTLQIITPEGYAPTELEAAQQMATTTGGKITLLHEVAAAEQTQAVYTDTWLSMGQQRDEAQVMADFAPYQVNQQLMQQLGAQYFMHCLPAQRGREVTAEVLDSPQAVVLKQAENRLYAQNAILCELLGAAA